VDDRLKIRLIDRLTGSEAGNLEDLAQALGMDVGREVELSDFLAEASTRARALAEAERRSRQANSTFRAASRAIVQSLDSRIALEDLLDYLNWMVPYDAAVVLMSEEGGRIVTKARREWRDDSSAATEAEALFLAREAAMEGEPVTMDTAEEHRLGLPLPGPGGGPGAAVLVRRGGPPFGEEELRTAEAFAGQAAGALRHSILFEELKRADIELLHSYDQTIEALSRALDLRDHETEGHTLRVADETVRLAASMGIPESAIVPIRRGALLHDIGKIGIPDAILNKPEKLDDDERETMKRHPLYAYDLLVGIPFLATALEIPYCHHERWDGSGYPRGLSGADIPLAARIFAVIDVWDALVNDRPYRNAIDAHAARELIARESGRHFDPEVVAAFLAMSAGKDRGPESGTEDRMRGVQPGPGL